MENKFIIEKIKALSNRVDYEYVITGEWKEYFTEDKFYVEYCENVEDVPTAILVIPLLCNILPIVWLCNATIKVEDLDADFYQSIDDFKRGYINMYPMLNFRGKLEVKSLVRNNVATGNNSASLFSGGVDAVSTFLSHKEEIHTLVTIWGADIQISDLPGWSKVKTHIDSFADRFQINTSYIKSTFRIFIKESRLTELVHISNDNWWHGFQHGIGIIGLSAPIAFVNQINKIYIASSFTANLKGEYTCASDPTIDNFVRFCGCHIVHDGYENDRLNKVKLINDYAIKNNSSIPVRVCWESTGGSNCCKCEKCYRTILEFVSLGANPNNFGFEWGESEIRRCKRDMLNRLIMSTSRIKNYYIPIQETMINNKELIINYKDYHWLVKLNMSRFNNLGMKPLRRSRLAQLIRKLIRHF